MSLLNLRRSSSVTSQKNVCLMLGHGRKPWPNIKLTLGQYIVFSGNIGWYSRTSYDNYRRLLTGRDGHLDQSEAYDIS